MTKKERILKTLKFEKTDIVPWKIGFTISAYKKMAEYYNDDDFIKRIGNHLASIEAKTITQGMTLG